MNRGNLRTLLFLAIGALMTGLIVAAYLTGFSKDLEHQTVDARFSLRGTEKAPTDLVFVDIDQRTFQVVDRQWPFPRAFHARVVDRLRKDGATVSGLDMQFTEQSDLGPEDDNALILSCRAARRCLIADTEPSPKGESNTFGGREGIKFARAHIGDGRFPQDRTGVVRQMGYDLASKLPTFAIVATEIADGRKISRSSLGGDRAWIDYYGETGTIRTVPYYKVCNCAKGAKVQQAAPGIFKNAIVVVGSSTSVLQDVHPTSIDHQMAGPEIQMNAIGTARRDFPLHDSPKWFDLLMIVLLGALAPLCGIRLKLWALAVAGVAGVAYAVGTQLAFNGGQVISFIYPMAALVLSSAGSLAVHYVTEAYERERVRG
ncbi:MAG: adenylate cyclase, partial [Solirubrobacteraceae bacterium]|nr:adenylate cyclase [Solirubrobacteraceae bacterium]